MESSSLAGCVSAAKTGRVVVTKKGKPIAVLVSVRGLDQEQIELGTSDKFWKLIDERRREKVVSRQEIEDKGIPDRLDKSSKHLKPRKRR
jgi:prevent-host-death family protein